MKSKLLQLALILLAFAGSVRAAEKLTYVIVHGATAGGWEWKKTGRFLAGDGHEVYENPAALALPVTYVAFVPKDKSAEERAATDKSWQRAKARGWTIRTFPGGHVAQQEDPRGVATLIEEAVGDKNTPVNQPTPP